MKHVIQYDSLEQLIAELKAWRRPIPSHEGVVRVQVGSVVTHSYPELGIQTKAVCIIAQVIDRQDHIHSWAGYLGYGEYHGDNLTKAKEMDQPPAHGKAAQRIWNRLWIDGRQLQVKVMGRLNHFLPLDYFRVTEAGMISLAGVGKGFSWHLGTLPKDGDEDAN